MLSSFQDSVTLTYINKSRFLVFLVVSISWPNLPQRTDSEAIDLPLQNDLPFKLGRLTDKIIKEADEGWGFLF